MSSTTQLAPAFRQQYFGTTGLPLAGGQIFTYAAGTSTPLATYTDETGATPNANPIVLDSTGTASIWLGTGSAYKFVVEDSLNNVIQTIDNIVTPSNRDINSNFSANNFLSGYTTMATAAGTTTLTVASTLQQYFTGSTTQTVKLPVTSTLVLGQQYIITNLSTGVVTVQSSGLNTLQAMASNSQLIATCISTSGTGTASWSWNYIPVLNSYPLPISLGGTGQSTANAGFNALSPMTTGGDLIYGGASGVATRLANGSSGQVLTSNGTTLAPSWTSSSAPAGKGYLNYYFPSSGTNYWSLTSTTYADFTANGTIPSPTNQQATGFTGVGGAASSLPGIALTAPSAGTIRVTALVNGLFADGGIISGVELVEAGGTVLDLWGIFSNTSLSTDQFQVTLIGYFVVTASTSYTFKIKGKINTGTLFLGGETSDNCLGFKIEYVI